MRTNGSKAHEYRGYQIVRHENGQTNCPGNPWPGSKFYYTVIKNDKEITSYGTLRQARVFIDTKLDRTPEEKKRIAELLATLN